MKVTLDHNVVIDLAKGSPNIQTLSRRLENRSLEAYVVEVGASEMRERGIQPDRYDLFEDLLRQAVLESVPRLTPLMVWDVSFWDRCIWGDDQTDAELTEIERVLFGDSQAVKPGNKAWLNRFCDVHTMSCHLHYGNDVFVTSDRNFHKATKKPALVALGAGRIVTPGEL